MGNACTKINENVYFQARKKAAKYNDALWSREGAADLLGISVSTLADYELGITKVVPVDKVVLMADLYNAPELKNGYCKNECPIGKSMAIATKVGSLEGVALRLLNVTDGDKLEEIKKLIISISCDGVIEDSEKHDLGEVLKWLSNLEFSLSELKLIGEKILGEKL